MACVAAARDVGKQGVRIGWSVPRKKQEDGKLCDHSVTRNEVMRISFLPKWVMP